MTANVIYTSQTDVIEHQVRCAHQQADFVIVGVHWGVEDSHAVVDGQRTLAQHLADWGADVDRGHPPACAAGCSVAEYSRRKADSSLPILWAIFLSTQNRPDQLVGAILTCSCKRPPSRTARCSVPCLRPQLPPRSPIMIAGKSNVRTYLFRDYTQKLAKQHGVRANHSDFSLDTDQKIAQNNISQRLSGAYIKPWNQLERRVDGQSGGFYVRSIENQYRDRPDDDQRAGRVIPGQQSVPVSADFCRHRRSRGYDQPECAPRHHH